MTTTGTSVHTGQQSRQAGGTLKLYRRSTGRPAPTITGQARCWWLRPDCAIPPDGQGGA